MAIDFPSPTIGQVFTVSGATWTWDGVKWTANGTPVVATGDNRIINGDMRIDQRNNGAAGSATQTYTIDRWFYGATQASKGNWSRFTSPSAPSIGFQYSLSFGSTSAFVCAAADHFEFRQPIEADAITDFAWGTPNAQPVTLSFWANSSSLGAYPAVFGGAVGNLTRSYPFTFTIPTAGTWTRVVITIPGDTAAGWTLSGNGIGTYLFFSLGVGSTYAAPAGAWASGDYRSATGAVSVVGTNAAQFNITGVKLEVGSVATPFNRQSLAKSLADCQRYYQQLGGVTGAEIILQGYISAVVNISCTIGIAAMRAAPTAARVGSWTMTNTTAVSLFPGLSTVGFQANPTAAGAVAVFNSVGAYLTLNAEL